MSLHIAARGLSMGALTAIIVAILVAVFAANKGQAEPVAYPSASEARFTVEVVGQGADVILIPGLGNSAEVWDATVEVLKPHYRVHILNIAGFAGVPAGANAQGEVIAPSVEALHDYIVSQGLENPIVVGHSMGGLMGLMLEIGHPGVVGKLIIVDALPYYGVIFNPAATVEVMQPIAARYRDVIINATAEQFLTMQQQIIPANAPEWGERVVGWTLTSDRRVFAQAFYDDLTLDMRDFVGGIEAPVVVLYPWSAASGHTAVRTDAVYVAEYEMVPDLRMTRIDDSSHFIMLDQPQRFHEALLEAMNRP